MKGRLFGKGRGGGQRGGAGWDESKSSSPELFPHTAARAPFEESAVVTAARAALPSQVLLDKPSSSHPAG